MLLYLDLQLMLKLMLLHRLLIISIFLSLHLPLSLSFFLSFFLFLYFSIFSCLFCVCFCSSRSTFFVSHKSLISHLSYGPTSIHPIQTLLMYHSTMQSRYVPASILTPKPFVFPPPPDNLFFLPSFLPPSLDVVSFLRAHSFIRGSNKIQ